MFMLGEESKSRGKGLPRSLLAIGLMDEDIEIKDDGGLDIIRCMFNAAPHSWVAMDVFVDVPADDCITPTDQPINNKRNAESGVDGHATKRVSTGPKDSSSVSPSAAASCHSTTEAMSKAKTATATAAAGFGSGEGSAAPSGLQKALNDENLKATTEYATLLASLEEEDAARLGLRWDKIGKKAMASEAHTSNPLMLRAEAREARVWYVTCTVCGKSSKAANVTKNPLKNMKQNHLQSAEHVRNLQEHRGLLESQTPAQKNAREVRRRLMGKGLPLVAEFRAGSGVSYRGRQGTVFEDLKLDCRLGSLACTNRLCPQTFKVEPSWTLDYRVGLHCLKIPKLETNERHRVEKEAKEEQENESQKNKPILKFFKVETQGDTGAITTKEGGRGSGKAPRSSGAHISRHADELAAKLRNGGGEGVGGGSST